MLFILSQLLCSWPWSGGHRLAIDDVLWFYLKELSSLIPTQWEIAQLKHSLSPRCFVVVHLLKGLFEVDLSVSPCFCIFLSTLGSGAFFQYQVSAIQLCICRVAMTLCMRTSPGGTSLTQPGLLQGSSRMAPEILFPGISVT